MLSSVSLEQNYEVLRLGDNNIATYPALSISLVRGSSTFVWVGVLCTRGRDLMVSAVYPW